MSFKRFVIRVAGLTLMVGPVSFGALAQDYIDVEAERERARQSGSSTDLPPRVSPGNSSAPMGGARSYGLDSQPAETVFRPRSERTEADTQQNVGNLFVQLQQLQQEVMRLNGRVEEQANEIRTLKEQSLERYMDLDRRLAGGGGAASAPIAAPAGSSRVDTLMQAGDASAEQPGEGDAYRAAYALVRSQEFDAAVTSFKQFLQRFPDGRYAPNAHYWLGELYLVVKPAAPELARQSFRLLLDEYPDNAKVPDAMYKLGQVHYVKGNRDKAREYLNRVIREHSDSAAANLAREFIDQNL
ncbi:MAG: tol-pal system protein YbgF [Pseudomonadales bacterium]